MTASSTDSLFFANLLPDSVNSWHKQDADEIYLPQNLHEFIDGGAELYISYGFQKLCHRTYSSPDQPDILVDVFDMGNSANAFGIFMHTRENVDSSFGQGSEYVQGFLNFWKDRFYISLLAMAETEDTKKALFALAKHIDTHIPGEGEIPSLVNKLPQQGLKTSSIRYFHHYVWLNSYIYLSNENIFKINDHDQIALARYANGTTLIIIQYADTSKSIQVWNELSQISFPELKNKQPFLRQKTWLQFYLQPPFLIVLANDDSPEPFKKLLNEIVQKLK
ncbi:MAG TPA: hypothetical protein ENL21_07125 [Caldithrix abyssi]|uniref:Uncharacterized protein n=1 Tax=Caldithrix abyssi TaxID=187145 RepID=A0A7V5H4H8_CALAY|nr:hypothetical protein [Caldithrix abyssi]